MEVVKVCYTAFEPWGGQETNSSQLVLQQVVKDSAELRQEGIDLRTEIFPVDMLRMRECAQQALETDNPDLCILTGQGGAKRVLSVEARSANYFFSIRNEAGEIIKTGGNLTPGLPSWTFSSLYGAMRDLDGMEGLSASEIARQRVENEVIKLEPLDVPKEASIHPGKFCCNAVYHFALELARKISKMPRVGFVHVPALQEQREADPEKEKFLTLAEAKRGIIGIIKGAVNKLRSERGIQSPV